MPLAPPTAPSGFARIIGGIDWGYTNPTAAVVFGLDADDRAWQLAELYLPRAALHETVYPALCELTTRYGVGVWYAGPDEPEHIAGLRLALERAASEQGPAAPLVPVIAADDAVVAGIQTVTRQLARRADGTRGLYVDPSCRWTIAEYGSYQYPPAELARGLGDDGVGAYGDAPSAGSLSELPLKANDHLMDATRYALHTHFAQVNAAQRTDGWLARWLPERPRADAATDVV